MNPNDQIRIEEIAYTVEGRRLTGRLAIPRGGTVPRCGHCP